MGHISHLTRSAQSLGRKGCLGQFGTDHRTSSPCLTQLLALGTRRLSAS